MSGKCITGVIILVLLFTLFGIGSDDVRTNIAGQPYDPSATANDEEWYEIIIADLSDSVGRRAVKIGDIDNDGQNEVVVGLESKYSYDQLRFYRNESGGWFQYNITDTTGYIHAVAIGDVDNDSLNEVVMGISLNNQEAELRYYKWESDAWAEYIIADPNITIFSIAIGDLDNDNVNEVAIGLMDYPNDDSELRYYEYNSGSWDVHHVDNDLLESDGVEIADIDHDGDNELIYLGLVAWWSSISALTYYDLEGSWIKHSVPGVHTGWEMDTGDVDNDGQIEIAWGNYVEPEYEVRVYDYENSNWVEHNVSDVKGSVPGTGIYHVAIGDVDNDGQNELAIGAGRLFLQVRYYEFDSEEWIEHNITSTPGTPEVVEIGDVDNDGLNEILVGLDYSTNELRYYENHHEPTPSVTTTDTYTTTSPTGGPSEPLDPTILVIVVTLPVIIVLVVGLWKLKRTK